MDHIVGKGWRDLFDVVITKARKPSFYHHQASRFVPLGVKQTHSVMRFAVTV